MCGASNHGPVSRSNAAVFPDAVSPRLAVFFSHPEQLKVQERRFLEQVYTPGRRNVTAGLVFQGQPFPATEQLKVQYLLWGTLFRDRGSASTINVTRPEEPDREISLPCFDWRVQITVQSSDENAPKSCSTTRDAPTVSRIECVREEDGAIRDEYALGWGGHWASTRGDHSHALCKKIKADADADAATACLDGFCC